MKYLKATFFWFFLLIIIYILADNYLTSVSIIPEPEYRQTFLKMESDLVFGFSSLAAILICPFFYASFRKKFWENKIWNTLWFLIYFAVLIFGYFSQITNLQTKPSLIVDNFVSFRKKCGAKYCYYEFSTTKLTNLKFSNSNGFFGEKESLKSNFIENLQAGDCISFYMWKNNNPTDFKKC